MTSTRTKRLSTLLRTALLTAAIAVTALGPSTGSAEGSGCDATKLKFPKVAAACTEGGKKAVTALMKKVVKEQSAAGNAITCESCHSDLKTFARKSNAEADLKKYLK